MSSPGQGKDTTDDFLVEDAAPSERQAPLEKETDPHRLAQRQKQVDFGKNTLGYQRYKAAVPRSQRRRKQDPSTPDVHQGCSKRAFDGQIKKWRRMLHAWDPPAEGGEGESAAEVALDAGSVAPRSPVEPETAPDAPTAPTETETGAKKGKELRRRSSLLPLLLGHSNKRSAEARGQEETAAQLECKQARPRWFSAAKPQKEPVQEGMPELDYSFSSDDEGTGWTNVTAKAHSMEWDEAAVTV